jgi:predicted RNA binding protein YcfA (HicA-like mRNA interferase family)
MNSAAIIKKLTQTGWTLTSSKGSHHKYTNPTTGKSVVMPHPKKDLPIGTAKSILKEADLK